MEVTSTVRSHDEHAAASSNDDKKDLPQKATPISKSAIVGSRQKPPRHIVDVASIPDDLKQERRWLGWKWVWKTNAWAKVPVDARSGMSKGWTSPDAWCSFEEAIAALNRHSVDGVGFMLGDGFSGIDPDDCRDPITGELTA
jgi:hypothetical protein